MQGKSCQAKNYKVVVMQKKGRKEKTVELRGPELSSGERGVQGDVGSHQAKGGNKEKSVELRGVESSSMGRGTEPPQLHRRNRRADDRGQMKEG